MNMKKLILRIVAAIPCIGVAMSAVIALALTTEYPVVVLLLISDGLAAFILLAFYEKIVEDLDNMVGIFFNRGKNE